MVAKIVSGKSIRGLLNYNENKVKIDQAALILANRFGADLNRLDFKSKLNRFQHVICLNSRVKTNAIHVMLNFDRCDKLDIPVLQEIAGSYMDKIGFSEQPYLAYFHKDASHPHLHIVTTNVQSDGKRISIHNIGKTLSEQARKNLENHFGLVRAEGRQQSEVTLTPIDIDHALYGKIPTKQAINNVVNGVLSSYKFTSLAEYNAVLGRFRVRADRGKEDTVMFEKRGLIYSIIDQHGKPVGIPFKASLLSNKPVLNRVESKYELNKDLRKLSQESLKQRIDSVFQRYDSITQNTFSKELHKLNAAVVFRKNDQGFIFGITFIDHRNKTVFNGSALGKAYSAKLLTARFSTADRPKRYLVPIHSSSTIKETGPSQSKSYLSPIKPTNYLEGLLGKPRSDFSSPMFKKKKRRKKGRTL